MSRFTGYIAHQPWTVKVSAGLLLLALIGLAIAKSSDKAYFMGGTVFCLGLFMAACGISILRANPAHRSRALHLHRRATAPATV